MADALFEVPRLAAIYDVFDGDRSDLEVYAAMAEESGARRVPDIGCGTGTAAGFTLDEIRDAPDRPGPERVFVARRAWRPGVTDPSRASPARGLTDTFGDCVRHSAVSSLPASPARPYRLHRPAPSGPAFSCRKERE